MSIETSSEITDLLLAWNDGEVSALEQLVPLVESEPRRLAELYAAQRAPATHNRQRQSMKRTCG